VTRPGALLQGGFAFAGGLAAYAAHLVVTFWLVSAGCPAGTGLVVAVATVAAAAVAAAAIVTGLRLRRRQRAEELLPPWLGRAGVYLSGLALAIIILSGVAAVVLPGCGA
jgi:hypothetical protein